MGTRSKDYDKVLEVTR